MITVYTGMFGLTVGEYVGTTLGDDGTYAGVEVGLGVKH
jgi:hypothetical protein